jgi:hypothetical protein
MDLAFYKWPKLWPPPNAMKWTSSGPLVFRAGIGPAHVCNSHYKPPLVMSSASESTDRPGIQAPEDMEDRGEGEGCWYQKGVGHSPRLISSRTDRLLRTIRSSLSQSVSLTVCAFVSVFSSETTPVSALNRVLGKLCHGLARSF